MKLTMVFNHRAAVMFPAFCGSFADGGVIMAPNGSSWFQGTEREKNAVRGGSDGI
jgi:hypothetical protein